MKKPVQDDVALSNVMEATGLSAKEARELLLITDDELDKLCDAALSDASEPNKKLAKPK